MYIKKTDCKQGLKKLSSFMSLRLQRSDHVTNSDQTGSQYDQYVICYVINLMALMALVCAVSQPV